MSIRTFAGLLEAVKDLAPVPVSVAGGADARVVASLKQAHEMGFVGRCYLAGPGDSVKRTVVESGDDPSLYTILDSSSDAGISGEAVRAVREHGAAILVKGTVKSEAYIRAILDSDKGIRASSVLSNLSLFEMSSLKSFLAITDNAILINPDLREKAAVIRNTAPLWKALGIEPVLVAALASVETVNPKMQATVDAASLAVMSARGQLPGFIVEGPLGYDAAISAECAASKKLMDSRVCGRPDMILAPNLETANSLGKSYKFHGGAVWGGLVFGASVPAVLNSRSDDHVNRLNSMAIARAIAEGCSLDGREDD
jgi:phosphate butyryltransferase